MVVALSSLSHFIPFYTKVEGSTGTMPLLLRRTSFILFWGNLLIHFYMLPCHTPENKQKEIEIAEYFRSYYFFSAKTFTYFIDIRSMYQFSEKLEYLGLTPIDTKRTRGFLSG